MSRVFIREKKLKDGRASLRLDYYEFGQRKVETLGIYINPKDKNSRNPFLREAYNEAMTKANQLKNKVELRLIEGSHGLTVTKYDQNACFLTYFNSFVPKKQCTWRNTYCHLIDYTKGRLSFGNLNEDFLERFQAYLLTKLHNNTAALYMNVLNTSLNIAVRKKLIPVNPYKYLPKIKIKEPKLRYLTLEQLKTLEGNCDDIPQWVQDAFFFACYTGLRISDIKGLQWSDIKYVSTADGVVEAHIEKRQQKTDNIVYIPLTPQAREILNRQARSKNEVFQMKSFTTVKFYIDRWREKVGFFFTFHSSRHTFGTLLQRAGSDINTTSKLMGHRNINQTLRYAKVVDQVRKESMNKLSLLLG